MSTVNKKGDTLLHLVVKSRSVEMVALPLEKGAATSAHDWKASTALHLAADGGYEYREIIDLLVDKLAKLDAVDQLGRTPLHQFAWLGYGATTKLIVDRGAVVDAADNDGRTARDLAAEGGGERVIKALNGEESGFYIFEGRLILL